MNYRTSLKSLTLGIGILLASGNIDAQIRPVAPQQDAATNAQYGAPNKGQQPGAYAGPDQDPNQGPYQDQNQQPTTSVARISLMQGNVSTQRGDTGDWTAATVNTPLVPGDRVSTGDRSRAEVQLDYANIIRLDSNAAVRITNLDPHHIQIELAQGLVGFVSFPASEADVEIDTPNLAIHPQRDGYYRIEVNDRGETLVTVRRGQAEVGTAEGSTTINPGQEITVRGDVASAQYRTGAAADRDGFDDWNENRDRTLRASLNKQNLSPYYTGGADLDQNGTWQNVPDYGQVWSPNNVPQNWAPYQNGSWVWEPGWGWTWVAAEPWGWAPYHYGRWFVWNGGWVWWPGPVYPYYRPLWAPAYVSFFGWGRGFGIGFGFGSFGWLPIGPADPFYPWWGGFGARFGFARFGEWGGRGFVAPLAGPLRGRQEFSNLRGLESNARLRAGITSVSAARFGNGRVMPDHHQFSAEEIRGAQFAHGGLPVAPTRGSLSASGRAAAPGTIPARNLDSQRFVMHSRPNVPQRSFASESENMRQQIERQRPGGNGARGGSPRSSFTRPDAGEQARAQAEVNRSFGTGRGDGNRGTAYTNGSQRSFAETQNNAARQQNFGNENGGGWQRFPQNGQPNSRGYGSNGRGTAGNPQRNANRRPLDLRQPIVQQRAPSYGGTSRGSYGYNPGVNPYYGGQRQAQQQPAYRAPEPQQRGYGAQPHYNAQQAPRGGNSGGAYRGGGGNRGGGGGSHSSGGGSHGGGSHGKPRG